MEYQAPHHDIAVLPSGNILALIWQRKTYDEAVQAGRNHTLVDSDLGVFTEQVIELQRIENSDGSDHWVIVWKWELWVIDHSTSTAEAAMSSGGYYHRGGDLLYRWGNAQAYGYPDDSYTYISGLHGGNADLNSQSLNGWGTFLMYHNNSGGESSQVVEMIPPITQDGHYRIGDEIEGVYGPIETLLAADIGVQEDNLGSVQRLNTGEIVTCDCAEGELILLDGDGKVMASMNLFDNSIDSDVGSASFRMDHYWTTDPNVLNIEK